MGHESQMNYGRHLTAVLLCWFRTDRLRAKKAMKTADKENPNRWDILVSNRAPGAGGQNRSLLNKWAAKQGNGQPLERCFLLTSTL